MTVERVKACEFEGCLASVRPSRDGTFRGVRFCEAHRPSICTIPGCSRPRVKRADGTILCPLCMGHLGRKQSHGSPTALKCRLCSRLFEAPDLKARARCVECENLTRSDLDAISRKRCAERRSLQERNNSEKPPQTKICVKCKRSKLLSDFVADRSSRRLDGRKNRCKDCYRPIHTAKTLRIKYGLSLEAWMSLYRSQGGACAICFNKYPPITDVAGRINRDRLVVDHDHKTGRVRGLLCVGCNAGLGNARESVFVLDSMKAYLVSHGAVLGLEVI